MKRKFDQLSSEDEIEKKSKVNDNDDCDEPIDFDVKVFRKKLKGDNFHNDLNFIVKNSEKSSQLISDFISLGGRPLEIVETIMRYEENIDVLSNLFQLLHQVCLNIAKSDQNQDSLVQGLKFLTTKNSSSITKIMNSAISKNKVTALSVLSIGISVNRDIGVEILRNVDIFLKSKSLDDFIEIFKTKKNQEQVRIAYVDFIISFFRNDTDTILRKRILQNKNLFQFLMQNIHKDNSQTIERILNILAEKVLMSSDFNKIEKFKIFNDEIVKYLIKLYEWNENDAEKNHIQEIAHYFLKLLLANKKYGIVFKPFAEKSKNLRQVEVIRIFKHVWMYEYPSKLVLEIVKACPDLIQIVLDRLVITLQPKVSKEWFMCMNFTQNLISALDPKIMINFFSSLNAKKVSANIIKLSISHYILQNVSDNALIQQENLEIREASVILLHLMLDSCCQYLDGLSKLTHLKDFEHHRIRFDVINHIFTFFPHIDIILNSLYRSINLSVRKRINESEVLVKSQLKHTLEILLLLIERFPSSVEKIPSVVDYLQVLRPIYEYQLNAGNIENNSNLEIEMKVVKIILLLQPNILSSDSKMFNKIFSIMIQVYSFSKNQNYQKEAKLLMSTLLQSTQIFPMNNKLEISLWIEALRHVKPLQTLKESANKFIEIIKSIKNSVATHVNLELKTFSQNLLKTIDNYEKCKMVEENNQLSPILTTILRMESAKFIKIIDFAELAFILFYHSYPELKKSLTNILTQESSEHCKKFLDYVIKDELCEFENILPTCTDLMYKKFQQAIIRSENIDLTNSNEEECKFLLLQSIFCSIKLSEEKGLTDEKIEFLIENIKSIMKNIQLSENQIQNIPESFNLEEMNDKKIINKISMISVESTMKIVINHVFNNDQSRLFKKFSVKDESNQLTKFLIKLIEVFNMSAFLKTSLTKYRNKVISQLNEEENNGANASIVMKIFEIFPFSDKEYIELIDIVLKMPDILLRLRLIMLLLKQIIKFKSVTLSSQQVQNLENTYKDAVKNPSFDFNSEFCDTFNHYLSIFIHNIGDTTTTLFEMTLLDEISLNRSFIKLLSTLFYYNDINNQFFIDNALKLKKEFLYPILHLAFKKELVDVKMTTALYQHFKSGILRTIEKPKKAAQIYRENSKSTILLIEKGMPINECRDLSLKKYKFDSTEIYQLEMLSAIFMKAFEKKDDKSDIICFNFINNWLQMFKLAEKKFYNEFEKVLSKWLSVAPKEVNCEKLDENNWEYFYTISLKLGLKSLENSSLLILLGKLIRILDIDVNLIATIFDMIVTHSNFCAVVFNLKSSGSKWKRDLFFLLNILVQRNPLIAHKKHIPIYLSSYQATISSCDQLILNLLRFYELNCDIDFFEFRPFLFGATALTHFSSLNQNELKISAKSVDEVKNSYFKVVDSFEKMTIANTMSNFPTKRTLTNYTLHDLDQFLNFSDECEDKLSQIYDPVFFLPLFGLFLNMENMNFISLAYKKNLIGLLPLGLSFEDENMRLMTSHILMKCRENIEGNKKKNELLVEFFDSIQKGLFELKKVLPKGHKNGDKIKFPRVAPLSSQLLGEFFNIIPNKLHCVHNIISNYIIVCNKFDFTSIPEMSVLLCSFELNQEEHRLFILNAINNGIKDELDFKLLNNTPFIKMLLTCYGSSISTRKIDLLILKIICNLVSKTNSMEFLVDRYGLVLWLYRVCAYVEAFEYDSIDMIVAIIYHLQSHFVKNSEKSKIIMSALVLLLEKFTKAKLIPNTFLQFISIVNSIHEAIFNISIRHYELVSEIAEIFIPQELKYHLEYIKRYPQILKIYNANDLLSESMLTFDESTKDILNQCRQFIKNFHSKKY